tara:strand:- start:136 stop:747 length:612 start_codon:yes stop_codon:yes gene_type:complete
MISIYKIKPKFQKALKPLLHLLHNLGITPNSITISSILFSFILSYFFYNAQEISFYYLIVALGLLFRMMLNALDGMMAKKYSLQSSLGEVLNEIGDVISDIAIYFPLILFSSLRIELAILFVVLSVLNEFCGILAKVISGERRYDGPMGKSDRAFLIGVICLCLYFNFAVDIYLDYIIGSANLLIIVSSFIRITKSINYEKIN